jgi:predicted ATP-dependent endonuclease of OLD family
MKITKLRIQGYKNIQDLTIEFADGLNYAAFVGLNGSGKSNIIEAVSIIFSYLYSDRKKKTIFDFELSYQINERLQIYHTENRTITEREIVRVSGSDPLSDYSREFPTNIIACYSGEETRLYENIYQQGYQEYFGKIKSPPRDRNTVNVEDINISVDKPKMMYIDKSCWEICVTAMLCSEKLEVKKFLGKIFGDLELANIGFSFTLGSLPNIRNSIVRFVKRLDDEQRAEHNGGYVSINFIGSIDIDGYPLTVQDIFYYLFMSCVPKEIQGANKLIKDLQLHGLDIKSLSEGEKKQILITFINEILADENSLVLLDEPDAHWHIERQKELAKSIASQLHFTILTTHSPILSKFLDLRSIYMLNNTNNNAELVDKQNICVINELSGGVLSLQEQNILFSSDEIVPLLVEGKGDVDYINKAISLFAENYPELQKLLIIPFGGATNAEYFVKEFTKAFPSNRKFIVLFDRDDAGCKQGLNKLAPDSIGKGGRRDSTKYYIANNMYCLMLPKPNGFSEDDFIIEAYFDKVYISATINKIIGEYKSISKVPKDIKDSLKSRLSKPEKLQNYKKEDFNNFKVLLEQLSEIILAVNPSNIVEAAALILPANQINIFADYAPRGQDKVRYKAIFDRTDKSVTYNGNKYISADKAMRAIRESVGIKTGQRAGLFWKYQNQETNQVENIQALLNK